MSTDKPRGEIHVNPDTGRTGKCRAKIECKFKIPDSEHFQTHEEAKAWYESKQNAKNPDVLEGSRKSSKPNIQTAKRFVDDPKANEDWNKLSELRIRRPLLEQKARSMGYALKHMERADEKLKKAEQWDQEVADGTRVISETQMNPYISSTIRELEETKSYDSERIKVSYADSSQELRVKLDEVFAAQKKKVQDHQKRMRSMDREEGKLKKSLRDTYGAEENPKYGVPEPGSSVVEKYKNARRAPYSANPTRNVPILKDAVRTCSSCDAPLHKKPGSLSFSHPDGSECFGSANPQCSYCGTTDPRYVTFRQEAYSDSTVCARCGGASGFGVGD